MNIRDGLAGRARLAAEVGLAAVFVATLAVTAAGISGTWGDNYWQFDCAAGTAVCATALVRRRHRAWAAVVGIAVAGAAILIARFAQLPTEPGPAMALGLAVLVGSAVRALPAPSAGAVAAGAFGIVAASHLAALPASSGGVPVMNGMGFLAALAVGLGLRLLDTRLRAAEETVRRDERLELARELHDVVAHHITGIVVQAQAAQLVSAKHPEKVADSLAGIEVAGSDALAAMRRVVGLLRDTDDAAPAMPRPEDLSALVGRFDGRGPTVRLQLPDGEPVWPPEVISTVYRVVQESLTNISRHAPHAGSVSVSVAEERQAVTVEVVDDAPPVPARRRHRGGYGLIGMRERVETLGGTLCAGRRPGAGWSVRATLPLPGSEPR